MFGVSPRPLTTAPFSVSEVLLAQLVVVAVQIGDAARHLNALGVEPGALADAVARVDRRLTVRGARAQVCVPVLFADAGCLRERLAGLVRARQAAEVGAIARARARDEEAHLLILRTGGREIRGAARRKDRRGDQWLEMLQSYCHRQLLRLSSPSKPSDSRSIAQLCCVPDTILQKSALGQPDCAHAACATIRE